MNLIPNATSRLSSPGSSSALKQTHAGTDTQTDVQTGEDDKEAKAPDLGKAMLDILDLPEDLDGPNNPALLALYEPANFDSNEQLQGMVAASSRLFRPDGM